MQLRCDFKKKFVRKCQSFILRNVVQIYHSNLECKFPDFVLKLTIYKLDVSNFQSSKDVRAGIDQNF